MSLTVVQRLVLHQDVVVSFFDGFLQLERTLVVCADSKCLSINRLPVLQVKRRSNRASALGAVVLRVTSWKFILQTAKCESNSTLTASE